MKSYGYVSVSIKTGMMGRTLHKSLDCIWCNNYITITDKELADKMKKCKKCFREEQTKLKGENKYDRRKQSS